MSFSSESRLSDVPVPLFPLESSESAFFPNNGLLIPRLGDGRRSVESPEMVSRHGLSLGLLFATGGENADENGTAAAEDL